MGKKLCCLLGFHNWVLPSRHEGGTAEECKFCRVKEEGKARWLHLIFLYGGILAGIMALGYISGLFGIYLGGFSDV